MTVESMGEITRADRRKFPPGPRPLPLIGNLLSMRHDRLGFFEQCAKDYGGIVGLRFASWPAVLVTDVELVEEVLSDKPGNMMKGQFLWRHLASLFRTGLPAANGDDWTRHRRMLTPAFAAKRVNGYAPGMNSACRSVMGQWRDGEVRDVQREMISLSMAITLKTLFDTEDSGEIGRMGALNHVIADEIGRRVSRPFFLPDSAPMPSHRGYRKALEEVREFCAQLVRERRIENRDRGDFLSRLMTDTDANGQPFTDEEIFDEAFSILVSSHETTATSLAWMLHLLAQDPGVQNDLRDEVAAVIGDRDIEPEDVRKLTLTGRVVTEAMRLYPPIWAMGRQNREPMELGGYHLPAGTQIYVSPWVMHRNPQYFADPTRFDPDRWTPEFTRSLPRCAYMPFSSGPRLCIGRSFALIEMTAALAAVIRKFHLTPEGGSAEAETSLALRPKGPLLMRLNAVT